MRSTVVDLVAACRVFVQADDLALSWRRFAGAAIARGYGISALSGDDARRVQESGLGGHLARALGVPNAYQEVAS